MLAGIATPEQAQQIVGKLRALLEYDHGLSTCAKRPQKFVCQWDYPNAWPPLQCVAIQALDRYGCQHDARRSAEKHVRMVSRNYETTGDLWEKYNLITGTADVAAEYKMPRVVGWTAGVFVFAAEYLNGQFSLRLPEQAVTRVVTFPGQQLRGRAIREGGVFWHSFARWIVGLWLGQICSNIGTKSE